MSRITHQSILEKWLLHLFPGENIVTNHRSNVFNNPDTGRSFEVDVCIPELHLYFEFQDYHHYGTTWYNQVPIDRVKHRDNSKKEVIHRQHGTLVQIPLWWATDKESLVSEINFSRPDLLWQSNTPTMSFNPIDTFMEDKLVPTIGEVMLASFVDSVASIPFSESISWWLGEKYDGIRFIWNSHLHKMFNRNGKEMDVAPAFVNVLLESNCFMDGEVWCGRGSYADSAKLMYNSITDSLAPYWSMARIVVFDNPEPRIHCFAFEKRYQSILEHVYDQQLPLIVSARSLCNNISLVSKAAHLAITDGGEGVILRKSFSLYESGRSTSLIKLKVARGDLEALVVSSHQDTHLLQLANGQEFEVNFSEMKLKTGDIVTVEFDSFTQNSVPVNPKISKVRYDMSWEEVLRITPGVVHQKLQQHKDSSRSHNRVSDSWESVPARRAYFDTLAQNQGFDPADTINWYTLSPTIIHSIEKHYFVSHYYKGDYGLALEHIYPDISFDRSKIDTWSNWQNTNKILDTTVEYDPFITENWQNSNKKLPMQLFYKQLLLNTIETNNSL